MGPVATWTGASQDQAVTLTHSNGVSITGPPVWVYLARGR